jgi:glycerol-3-phosphate dehydrogenase
VRAERFDIAIIGGGINGCGLARDAAGRGLSVYLCDKSDLASGTSSKSTKLVHGGLRYLEYYEFRLVREALKEREVLLGLAPHIIRPLRFVLPHHTGLRSAWLIRLGLFFYDHLGGRELLAPARRLDLTKHEAGPPLQPQYRSAFEYSDCSVDDSRLVILNAVDAAERGAVIETRTEMVKADRRSGAWHVVLQDTTTGAERVVTARALVNASGPWVAKITSERLGLAVDAPVRLVKGSHIVLKRLFRHDRAYIFQQADGRIVFAIPHEGDFTLIGTTDLDYDRDPGEAFATEAEIEYLCAAASGYFRQRILPGDVVHTYAGVRPLYDDGATAAQAATRDYVLKVDGGAGEPPLLNIIGGKITTYRRLAEAALDKLAEYLTILRKPWTGRVPLPGGDFPITGVNAEAMKLQALCPVLKFSQAERLARSYGTRARKIVEGARSETDFGVPFGADLTEREVRYQMEHEWARTAEDVLWRRSKLGLRLTGAEARRLDDWMHGCTGLLEPAAAIGGGAR